MSVYAGAHCRLLTSVCMSMYAGAHFPAVGAGPGIQNSKQSLMNTHQGIFVLLGLTCIAILSVTQTSVFYGQGILCPGLCIW